MSSPLFSLVPFGMTESSEVTDMCSEDIFSSSNSSANALSTRGRHFDHSHTETVEITVTEFFIYHGQEYAIVEAVSVEVYVSEGSHNKAREALALPGGSHHKGSHCRQTTITLAVDEEVVIHNTHYEVAVAIEVVVEIIENGCSH